ncbi:MAG: hypothetical protein CMF41_03250 [Legionellales bacterium]|nr:hypothetical protein [Legionellales bacterium]
MNKFFDYASGSPIHPLVLEEMMPYWSDSFMNIASNNKQSNELKELMNSRLEKIGDLLGLNPDGLIVTSGATESINYAIIGATEYYAKDNKVHIVTSKVEHSATLAVCEHLASLGHKITYVNVDESGLIDINHFQEIVQESPFLACFHHVNNETGVIQPVERLCDIGKEKGVLMHIDASQTFGKLLVDFGSWSADYISFCSHKTQGPTGVGLLYRLQKPLRHLSPLIHGKGINYRPGTFPMALFMGMARAIELSMETHHQHVLKLKNTMLSLLDSHIISNVEAECTVPHIINLYCKDIFNDLMLSALPEYVFSVGSACTSQLNTPSHVLRAMGLSDDRIRCSLRISFHKSQKIEDVKLFAQQLNNAFIKLREFLPHESI